MIKQQKKTANAVSGKTARACESCLKRRARWHCPADDAFLCQSCDSSVHSANELASRHKRVRLETASFKGNPASNNNNTIHTRNQAHSMVPPASSWHHGFTRKARSPRVTKSKLSIERKTTSSCLPPLVPEIGRDEDEDSPNYEETEEQMLFSVPVFDPFDVDHEFNKSSSSTKGRSGINDHNHDHEGFDLSLIGFEDEGHQDDWDNYLPGFLPSDADLAEFVADVESLLEGGTEEEKENLIEGFEEYKDEISNRGSDDRVCFQQKKGVKLEDELLGESGCNLEDMMSIDVAKEVLNFNVNYDHSSCNSLIMGLDEEEIEKMMGEKTLAVSTVGVGDGRGANKKRKIFLRLNYDDVINAWSSQGSPWTTGTRPDIDPDDGWPDSMGGVVPTIKTEMYHHSAAGEVVGGRAGEDDGGRGARVLRYREKRKNRLFAKKIRYEVRKLNAEKRPRLKGRFVKRSTMMTTSK